MRRRKVKIGDQARVLDFYLPGLGRKVNVIQKDKKDKDFIARDKNGNQKSYYYWELELITN